MRVSIKTVVEFVRAPDRLSNTVEQIVCCDQCALNKIGLMAPLLLTVKAAFHVGKSCNRGKKQGAGVRKVQVFRKRGEGTENFIRLK